VEQMARQTCKNQLMQMRYLVVNVLELLSHWDAVEMVLLPSHFSRHFSCSEAVVEERTLDSLQYRGTIQIEFWKCAISVLGASQEFALCCIVCPFRYLYSGLCPTRSISIQSQLCSVFKTGNLILRKR
jgi:formate hydrogenlyase subunit 6/NADH:ubiquinone oxidoreductase subunit I